MSSTTFCLRVNPRHPPRNRQTSRHGIGGQPKAGGDASQWLRLILVRTGCCPGTAEGSTEARRYEIDQEGATGRSRDLKYGRPESLRT